MKNRSIITFLGLLALTFVAPQLQAAFDENVDFTIEPVKEYGKNTKTGFELINNSNKPIWITVINGSSTVVKEQEVNAYSPLRTSDEIQAEININKETILNIWLTQPTKMAAERKWYNFFGPAMTTTKPDLTYTFTPGKTVYVTLGKNGHLTSTQPTLKGGINKTASGLNLNNNTSIDIVDQIK